MGKYTPPPVTVHDICEALPALPMPLSMRCTYVPTRNAAGRVYAAVELVYYGVRGEAYVYKRWGKDVRAADTAAVNKTLLLAAQEAWVYCEKKDPVELTRFVEWQLDLPKSYG